MTVDSPPLYVSDLVRNFVQGQKKLPTNTICIWYEVVMMQMLYKWTDTDGSSFTVIIMTCLNSSIKIYHYKDRKIAINKFWHCHFIPSNFTPISLNTIQFMPYFCDQSWNPLWSNVLSNFILKLYAFCSLSVLPRQRSLQETPCCKTIR